PTVEPLVDTEHDAELDVAPEAAQVPEGTAAAPRSRPRHRHAAAASWRDSARRQDYADAYARLRDEGPSSVRDVPDHLLRAADVARWSGHPGEAVPYLERVVREHAEDPRAQLAAFTLGRVYMDELGRPRLAAAAFARARAFAPRGPLAEDALFHEIEC